MMLTLYLMNGGDNSAGINADALWSFGTFFAEMTLLAVLLQENFSVLIDQDLLIPE